MRFRSKISIINVSAILNYKTLKNVKKQYKFSRRIKIFRTFFDRLKIYLQFSKLRYSITSIRDLEHILLRIVQKTNNIFKTIIYIDKINQVNKICEHI